MNFAFDSEMPDGFLIIQSLLENTILFQEVSPGQFPLLVQDGMTLELALLVAVYSFGAIALIIIGYAVFTILYWLALPFTWLPLSIYYWIVCGGVEVKRLHLNWLTSLIPTYYIHIEKEAFYSLFFPWYSACDGKSYL